MDTSQQFKDVKFAAENVIISLEQALRHAEAGIGRKLNEKASPELGALKDALHEAALEFTRTRLKLLSELRLPTKAVFINQPKPSNLSAAQCSIHGNC